MSFSVYPALTAVAAVVNQFREKFSDFYTTKSLPEITKLTRVEPLTILSKDCMNLDYIQDVNSSALNIFCAYYLQAVAMLTKVNDVNVVRTLDSLNPDRDSTGFLLHEKATRDNAKFQLERNAFESISNMSLESYKHSLPTAQVPALEADDKNDLQSVSNLSVGKLLDVEIAYNKSGTDNEMQKVKLPVSVRLMVSVIPNSTITHLLTYKTEDNSVVERWHAWRGGRIDFIKDLIFCQDLIDEYKKAHINDDSGTMQEIMRRVNNSKKFGLLTKNPSLVSASNIFIMSEEVAREVEQKLGGKLSNAKVREKAFDNTYAMMLVVVDREWDRVTFYTRGISASTDLSVKEIKAANKSKGPDIADMLRAMQSGSAPMF